MVSVRWYRLVTVRPGRRRITVRRLLAAGSVTLSHAGRATLALRLDRRGLRALAGARRPLRMLAAGTLRRPHAPPISASAGFVLRVGH
jgi:hypothetical protein